MKKKTAIVCSMLLIFSMLLGGCGSKSDKDYVAADCIKLADYSGIEVDTSVKDSEVDTELNNLKTSNPEYNIIKNRKCKSGDMVNINYVGKIDGKTFEGGSADKQDLTLGSGGMIPGFEDGIVGMKPGEKKVIDVTFPSDYQTKAVQGKKAKFTITLNSIKEEKEVKVDDAWIAKVTKGNGDYKTLDAYKKATKEKLQESKKENAGATALSTLCEKTEVTKYPDSLVKKYKEDIKEQFSLTLQMYGMTMETYYTQAKTTEAKFNEQLDTAAKEQTKKSLIMEVLSDKEKLTISTEDKKKEIKTLITSYQAENEEALRKTFKETYKTDLDEYVNDTLLEEKVTNFLKGKAKIK